MIIIYQLGIIHIVASQLHCISRNEQNKQDLGWSVLLLIAKWPVVSKLKHTRIRFISLLRNVQQFIFDVRSTLFNLSVVCTKGRHQWLLHLLTNQIAHQGFWIFKWLRLPLDSEDGFSHQQQSFSGLQSCRWSFSIKVLFLIGQLG